jgi:glycosyltransferase involved in cell wall biosynthesis
MEKLRRNFAFDIVLCSWVYPDGCAVASLAGEMKFPFVVIAQGSDVHQYLQMPERRGIIVESMRGANAMITRSGELAQMLADAGVPKERIHTVYNGVDFSVFHHSDRTAARRELGLPPDARIVLFVGNFYTIKNPLLLAEAVADLHRDRTMDKLLLVMIGGGPLEKSARNQAGRSGIRDAVRFEGRKTPAQVARYMQAADVLCVPSRHEGVPNVILEAFACGIPVVASRVGGIPEVVRHDFLGNLVESENCTALADALRHRIAMLTDSDSIAAYARGFSWKATAVDCVAILERARG